MLSNVDDFDKYEPSSRALEMLFSLVITRPLVCVLAARPGAGTPHLDRLSRFMEERKALVRLPLGPLSDEAAAAVAEDGIRQQPRDCSYRFISLN